MSLSGSGAASALLRIGCFVGACVGVACALRARQRRPQRQLPRRGSSLNLLYKLMDLGGFFGVDIGGTLAKVVFFLPDKELATRMLVRLASQRSRQAEWHAKLRSVHQLAGFILSNDRYGATGVRDGDLAIDLPELGGSFHFIRFETRRMQGALRLAAKHGLGAGMHRICTTGGGALKFRQAAKDTLNVDLDPMDEIDCLVKGMAFLMAHCEQEAYTWEGDRRIFRPIQTTHYPFILANVGSGAGFIVVHSEHRWERVSGTSMGGGTFYGLCHLLTGETSFDRMLDGAEGGNNEGVDLTVGDIYGGDYSKFGLKAATIAASFGKAVTWTHSGFASGASGGGGGGAGAGPTSPAAASAAGAAGGDLRARPPAAAVSPYTVEDGSFRSVGKRGSVSSPPGDSTGGRLRGQSERGLPSGAPAPVLTPVLRSWDPAAVMASAAAAEGSSEEGGEEEEGGGAAAAASAASASASASASAVTAAEAETASASAPDAGAGASSPSGHRSRLPSAESPNGGLPSSSPSASWEPSDAYRSLLIMISNNLGQLAYLNAVRYKCKHIYFAGNFLRTNNTVAMRTLAYSITFWSKGAMEGLFLRHEGYCGALGAFLATLEQPTPFS